MTDNRFSKCETAGAVLRSFRQLEDVDADDHDDALARIAELSPRTVTAEQQERAREVLGSALIAALARKAGSGTDAAITQTLDRIIDALGWTAAQVTTDKYGRNACVCGYVPPTHTHADDCPVFGTQARAQAPTPAPATPTAEPERDCENCGGRKCMSCCAREMHDDCADDCPMCCPAPATPAVELTAPELESLAGIVRAHERTPIDLGPIAFSLRSVPMVVEDMPERDGAKLDGVSVLRIGGRQ